MCYSKFLSLLQCGLTADTKAELRVFYPNKRMCKRVQQLMQAVLDGDVKQLIELTDAVRNTADFGRKFNIPQRTLSGWVLKQRTAPEYVVQLLSYAVLSELEERYAK